jgi:hypothetical protein
MITTITLEGGSSCTVHFAGRGHHRSSKWIGDDPVVIGTSLNIERGTKKETFLASIAGNGDAGQGRFFCLHQGIWHGWGGLPDAGFVDFGAGS